VLGSLELSHTAIVDDEAPLRIVVAPKYRPRDFTLITPAAEMRNHQVSSESNTGRGGAK
jgi:hypothetical protein